MRSELRFIARPSVDAIRRKEMANQAGFPWSQNLPLVAENVSPHVALQNGIALKGGARQVGCSNSEHVALDIGRFYHMIGSLATCMPRAFWIITKLALFGHTNYSDYRAQLV